MSLLLHRPVVIPAAAQAAVHPNLVLHRPLRLSRLRHRDPEVLRQAAAVPPAVGIRTRRLVRAMAHLARVLDRRLTLSQALEATHPAAAAHPEATTQATRVRHLP